MKAQDRRFGLGGLVGIGYGLNISYAIRINDSTLNRNELFSIIYSADWYNSYPQGTRGNTYNQKLISSGHDFFGVAFGYRIIKKHLGYGACIDILFKRKWDNYYSDIVGGLHTPIQEKRFLGISGIVSTMINKRCRANLIIGSNIYMMVGIEWLFY
jgi:hypothetical protein